MTSHDQVPPIVVIPARPKDRPILENLLELYAREFSEFHEVELSADGRFRYDALPLYWQEADRHPFLIHADRKLAGFALVKKGSEISGDEAVWDMAEFFILREYRGRGVGCAAAHVVWRRFPGRWEVRTMEANQAALPFWQRAVSEFVGAIARPKAVEKNGQTWYVFGFDSVASQ
jgi:predicted acetyltransferase